VAELEWNGDKILARIEAASRIGINQTMAICVAEAKATHPFTNRTGLAERSIVIAQRARTTGSISYGQWGSVAVNYFKYLEFGTRFTRTRTSIKDRMRIMRTGIFKTGPKNKGVPPWQGGSWAPTLGPAANRVYPLLSDFIRRAYRSMA
jgi:hypothetical protein